MSNKLNTSWEDRLLSKYNPAGIILIFNNGFIVCMSVKVKNAFKLLENASYTGEDICKEITAVIFY